MLRRTGTLSLHTLVCCLFVGSTAVARCQTFSLGNIGPTKGEVIAGSVLGGAIITAAIVVPIIVIHNKHTIQGCVFQGADGLEVQNGQPGSFNNYSLAGNLAEIKTGDRVKLHGQKLKRSKGLSGSQTFTVDRVSNDYGPLQGSSQPAARPKTGGYAKVLAAS